MITKLLKERTAEDVKSKNNLFWLEDSVDVFRNWCVEVSPPDGSKPIHVVGRVECASIGQGIATSNLCLEIFQPTWVEESNVKHEVVKRADLYSELAVMKEQLVTNAHTTRVTVKAEVECEMAAMRHKMDDMMSRIETLERKNTQMEYQLFEAQTTTRRLQSELNVTAAELTRARAQQTQQVRYGTSTRPTTWFEEQYLCRPDKSYYYGKPAEDANDFRFVTVGHLARQPEAVEQPAHSHVDLMSLYKKTADVEAAMLDCLFTKETIAEGDSDNSPVSKMWAGYTGPRLSDLTVAPSAGYVKTPVSIGLIKTEAQTTDLAKSVGSAVAAITGTSDLWTLSK